jgi:probable addiction module antidote protein
MVTPIRHRDFSGFDASDYLDSPEGIAEYLAAASEDENPDVLLRALADVAKARGMANVAKAAGLGRESLYKALAPGAHPRHETVHAVMRALGVRFAVAPLKKQRRAKVVISAE